MVNIHGARARDNRYSPANAKQCRHKSSCADQVFVYANADVKSVVNGTSASALESTPSVVIDRQLLGRHRCFSFGDLLFDNRSVLPHLLRLGRDARDETIRRRACTLADECLPSACVLVKFVQITISNLLRWEPFWRLEQRRRRRRRGKARGEEEEEEETATVQVQFQFNTR